MNKFFKVFVYSSLLTIVSYQCVAIEFTRCDFVRELYDFGIPEANIYNHVCSAMENRLSKDTRQTDGESLGFYSINRRFWCDRGERGCAIECSKLLDDNLTDDITCALAIMKEQGMNAWQRTCNDATRREVENCITEAKIGNILDQNADPDIDVRIS